LNNTGENREKYRWFEQARQAVYYLLGVIEVLMAFRLIFKLLGANPQNGFVAFLYSITGILAAPFFGIFRTFSAGVNGTKSVFEPATLISMIVYAVLARGIVSLMRLRTAV
jgi:hypothetical protein